MKCNELMAGDWITDEYKLPMQVYHVDMGRAYADSGCTLYEFNKDYPPHPIGITRELLKANGWDFYTCRRIDDTYITYCSEDENGNHLEWGRGILSIWLDYENNNDGLYSDIVIPVKYVHQLQQVLRLAGMTELANNFKIY